MVFSLSGETLLSGRACTKCVGHESLRPREAADKKMLEIKRFTSTLRWWSGMRVAAPELEVGKDETVTAFYQGRITDCNFLEDGSHYEYPRARWILERVTGGRLLEIGCGNGGMTRLLAPKVQFVEALDISKPSLEVIDGLGLGNVKTVETLVEHHKPVVQFDWIVMSEVLEHLREPGEVVSRCVQWLAPGGRLLLTTPNGHWESDEHLHEFSLPTLSQLLAVSGAEGFLAGYLRDVQGRRRWLVADANVAKNSATADDFNDRLVTIRHRRRREG